MSNLARNTRAAAAPHGAPLRFDQRLPLSQWMLGLFDRNGWRDLAERLREPELEGLDAENHHRFLTAMPLAWESGDLPMEQLLAYDERIVHDTMKLNARRPDPIRWKYFQYLALLFTEVYLDRFFRDPGGLRDAVNERVEEVNRDLPARDRLPLCGPEDLRKLAFWSATGSGKTLLMHMHILQFRRHLEEARAKRLDPLDPLRRGSLNRTLLLTPNEGLSVQHLGEFAHSPIQAELFRKDARSLFSGDAVEIIDIHKLKEQGKEKTVAIEAFESNNLLLVDEGHRGSSSERGAWMDARRRLCEDGFSFEYSATFGQAVKGSRDLEKQYAKCILFDYSYKHFYRDGFGKDYRILNLADDSDGDRRTLYLTACLLAFYQQQRLYADKTSEMRRFLLERPLWIFVGGSVNAVRTSEGREVSDVVDILLFLAGFVSDRKRSVGLLGRLMSGAPGLLDSNSREIFANTFEYLGECGDSPEAVFDDVLRRLFNAPAPAKLHAELLKGAEGEIALRIGDGDPFGLINVGDAAKLHDLCDKQSELEATETQFSGSLFHELSANGSTVNVLIGSKKFTEGWNSWRVSTMGLMNIGRTEGSEIIQLFGRGVRLKGHGMSLKRSGELRGLEKPDHIGVLETLNIFGVRADYMAQFKDYLAEEGLPTNEDRIEFILPVVKGLNGKKLKAVRVEKGLSYRRNGDRPRFGAPPAGMRLPAVTLDWYPRIQTAQSRGVREGADAEQHEAALESKHLAFLDHEAVWLALQEHKNERGYWNLAVPREAVPELLHRADWYRLLIPPQALEPTSFRQVLGWQDIAIALLRKYMDRFYRHAQSEWEKEHLEYYELTEDDPNFVKEYRMLIDRSEARIVEKLEELKALLESGAFRHDLEFGPNVALWFGQHLYQPLLHVRGDAVQVAPVSLNEGERDFAMDLRAFYEGQPGYFAEREMYLLRNQSRGRGIGFFEAGNFYPDFILWVLAGGKQYVSFVDPKGIRNLQGPEDPKIGFHETIKGIETRLGDPDVILNSFILSNTPHADVSWWGLSPAEFADRHVLFQVDDRQGYIGKMLGVLEADDA